MRLTGRNIKQRTQFRKLTKTKTQGSIGGYSETWAEVSHSDFYGHVYKITADELRQDNRRKYNATHRLIIFELNVSLSNSDRIKNISDSKQFKVIDVETVINHIDVELEEVTN